VNANVLNFLHLF